MLLLLLSLGHPQVEEIFLYFLEINFYLLILLYKYLPHAYLSGIVLGTLMTRATQTGLGKANSMQEENKISIIMFANQNCYLWKILWCPQFN